MRLGLIPGNPLERLLLALGVLPQPLVLGFWGMGASSVLLTGTSLGVFELLARGPRTAYEVAAAIDGDPAGTETLLDALNGIGYLKRRGGRYSNSKLASKWLVRSSPSSMVDALLFYKDIWNVLGGMEESVKTGKTLDLHHSGQPPEFWERYMRGLAIFAGYVSAEVARKVRVASPPARVLDVAGGHGAYSVGFCRRYPDLAADVLDLPEAAAVGRTIVAEQGMTDRVRFIEGDLRTAEWGDGYDLVLLFNIIHNVTPDEARAAMAKARAALRDGGTVAVLDGEHARTGGDLSMTAGLNELLFFATSGTRAYPEDTIRGWMTDAGFSGLRTQRLMALPMTVLITGTA